MGNSTSKAAARTASKISSTNTARKYPTRIPPSSNRTNAQPQRPIPDAKLGPTVYPEVRATEERDQGIILDASDPDLALAARMRQLGPVHHNNTSSSNNQTTPPPPGTLSPTNPGATDFRPTNFQPSASSPSQTVFPARNAVGGRENAAVSLLTARYRLAEEAEREFAEMGRRGEKGRRFLDVFTIRRVLGMREEGVEEGEIERRLGLAQGSVARLGRRGVVGLGGVE